MGLFVAFVLMQCVLGAFLVLSGALFYSAISFRVCLGLLALFVLADAVVVMGISRSEILIHADLRIEKVEKELQEQLEEYEAMNKEVRQIARLRHDARNHLQVIASLEAKGEAEAAQRMAQEIASRYLREHADV